MALTHDDLQSFQQFASQLITSGASELSLEELAYQWQLANERDEVNDIIRKGLSDIDSGNHRPAREVTEELAQKYNLPSQ